MQLTDLRVCDKCGGPIGLIFNKVTVTFMAVKPDSVKKAMHLTQGLGLPIGILEATGTTDHEPIVEGGKGEGLEDIPPVELLLCQGCSSDKVCISRLVEKRREALSE